MSIKSFKEYDREARRTALYPRVGATQCAGIVYPALGLAGETGEICEKVKKALRDERGVLSGATRQALLRELGDCLWYISALAGELSLDDGSPAGLELVANMNLLKLRERAANGTIGGSGDDRETSAQLELALKGRK